MWTSQAGMASNRSGARLRCLALTLLVCCLALCFRSAPAQASLLSRTALGKKQNVSIELWVYQSDSLRVKGKLYVPADRTRGKLPCVVFSHDGISGISRQHELCCLKMAKRGYVVFAPSYRGEDGSQGSIEIAKGEVNDVLAVLPLLKQVSVADANNVVLMGASHGALISLLAAGRQPRIKGVIFAYGVADIYSWWEYLVDNHKLGNDAITKRTYGDGPKDRPQSFALRHGLSAVPKLKCPVLILQGELDTITPKEQAIALQRELTDNSIQNKLCLYPSALHGFLVYAPYLTKDVTKAEKAQATAAWSEVFTFLNKVTGQNK